MNKKYLFLILINIFGCLGCNIENHSIEMKESEKMVHNNEKKTIFRKLLELCCSSCTVEENEDNNDSILDNKTTPINFEVDYYDNDFENITSIIYKIKNKENKKNKINTYYTKFENNSNKESYIELNMSTIESTLEKMQNKILMLNENSHSFSKIINEKFKEQKYEFYTYYLFQNKSTENSLFIKISIKPKLVELYSVEKEIWKKMNSKILDESDLYTEFPLISRSLFGACPVNAKKLMTATHVPLFFPALINGKLITSHYLVDLIDKKLKILEKNKQASKEENIDNDLVPELTIDDFIEDKTAKSPSSICESINHDMKSRNNADKEFDSLIFDYSINEKEIRPLIKDFVNKSSNSWFLINMKPVKLNSIPKGYVLPSTGEALFIMLYAIENNIEIILTSGILTIDKKSKSNNNYYIEYNKAFNSIKLKAKPLQEDFMVIIKKENYEEDNSTKKTYQKAFMPSEYSYFTCPEYCFHETVLLKNPFFCCKDYCSICNNSTFCRCPAINEFCIYPTSESWCDRL